jgi:hypothetical protein
MYAVYAIAPNGTEMVAEVLPDENLANEVRADMERERGDLWMFVVRKVWVAE